MGPILLGHEHLVPRGDDGSGPARSSKEIFQRILSLAPAGVDQAGRNVAAGRHSLHIPRRPRGDRVGIHRIDHPHARGGARRPLRQHRPAVPAVLAGARPDVGPVRRAAVHVSRFARGRRVVEGEVRAEQGRGGPPLGYHRRGSDRDAPVSRLCAKGDDRRAVLREGIVRAGRGGDDAGTDRRARRRDREGRAGGAVPPSPPFGAPSPLRRGELLLSRVRPRRDGRPSDEGFLREEGRIHRR
mmetsp:Transcript_27964/g.82225  ORF Transcript_27964/g.82225 Transcript_27964/m.82225 type:complete len:242 (-) Transcript_27964:512-1237(-)